MAAKTAEIELEHTIGINIHCHNATYYTTSSEQKAPVDSEEDEYLLVCGSSIVLCSFKNAHFQSFLRGHTASIECCATSPNKALIASAQNGSTPDVYVWNRSEKKLLYKLEEHKQRVIRMAYSDDSRFLATVGDVGDGKLYIWDMSNGYIVTSTTIPPSTCNDIVWGGRVKDVKRRPTTDYLFGTCGDNEVRIWAMSPSSGKLLSEKCVTSNLHSYRRVFSCLAFSESGDLVIAGTLSGDFFIFDVRRLSAISSFQTNCVAGIQCIACCDLRGQYVHDPLSQQYFVRIMAGCGDGTVSVWHYDDDLETFIEQKKIAVGYGSVQSMDIHSRKDKLLIASSKGNVCEITLQSKHDDNDSNSNSNHHAQKENLNLKQTTHVTDVDVNSCKVISYNETSNVVGVRFPTNVSDAFVTVSEFGSIRKWSMNDYAVVLSHDAHLSAATSPQTQTQPEHTLRALCFDFNDEVIITGWSDGGIRAYNSNQSNDGLLWQIKDAHHHGSHRLMGDAVTSLRLAYNQKYIVSAGMDGALRVWDIRFKKLQCHLKEHSNAINAIELYSDSRHILSCSKDRSFICWDLSAQKRVSCHRQNIGTMNDVQLSHDEQAVITVGSDRCVTFWDIRQTKPVQCIANAHDADINCVELSHQTPSPMIATADTQSVLKIWDMKTYKLMTQQTAACGKINGVAFSFDDKQIVSVAQDSSIMIWNVFTM